MNENYMMDDDRLRKWLDTMIRKLNGAEDWDSNDDWWDTIIDYRKNVPIYTRNIIVLGIGPTDLTSVIIDDGYECVYMVDEENEIVWHSAHYDNGDAAYRLLGEFFNKASGFTGEEG